MLAIVRTVVFDYIVELQHDWYQISQIIKTLSPWFTMSLDWRASEILGLFLYIINFATKFHENEAEFRTYCENSETKRLGRGREKWAEVMKMNWLLVLLINTVLSNLYLTGFSMILSVK